MFVPPFVDSKFGSIVWYIGINKLNVIRIY